MSRTVAIGALALLLAGCATYADQRVEPARTSFIVPATVTEARTCIVDAAQSARLLGVPYAIQVVPLGDGGWTISHGADTRSFIDITPSDRGTMIEHRRSGLLLADPLDNVIAHCREALA